MKINIDNYELYFLRYIEGRLSEEERKEVETFLIQHPDLKEIMDMYDPSFTLVKDEELVFDEKDSLMHPKSSFVMPLWMRYASVAAVALFVVSAGLVWMQQQQTIHHDVVLADNATDIDIIEEKYVPMISDSIIEDEKLEEVISTTKNVMHKDNQRETMLLAQVEPMESEQPTVEIEEESINVDTTVYMYDNLDEEIYYAMNIEENILDMEEETDDNDVYLEEYSNSLIAYNVGRAAENTMDDSDTDTIYCEYTELDIDEPMPLIEQFKEMFTTLFRDKKEKVESDLIEYADYVKLEYYEKKEEISMYIASRVERIF